ncbi:hypothetical protein [Nonomuraea sp. NPDC048826]|uniref:hypothetical protein n=1 Tax=Nonomuraea sp. NPDC048826 TaxID=3364347 RepID=UPI00371DA168
MDHAKQSFLWQCGHAKLVIVEHHENRRSSSVRMRAANERGMDRLGAWANWSGLVMGLFIALPRVAEILTGSPDGFVTAGWGPAARWIETITYMLLGCLMAVISVEALKCRYRRRQVSVG